MNSNSTTGVEIMSKQFIVNCEVFRGVFPHKGAHCARFDTSHGRVWKPVPKGSEIVLADVRSGGQGYIKPDCLTAETLEKLPPWGRHLPRPENYPNTIFQLSKDWVTEDWSLGGTRRNTIPAGSHIMYADSTYYDTGWYVW
jgi:hypothetical protein